MRLFLLLSLAGGLLFTGCENNQNVPINRAGFARALPVETPHVLVTTTEGDFIIQLYANQAPISVENFLDHVASDFYDGTVFHRVIPGYVAQGGGYTDQLEEKPTRGNIRNEAHNGLINRRGTVAMARTRERDSAQAQLFINLDDNELLDHGVRDYGYAVFGEVIMGMDVVERIAQRETIDRGRFQDLPTQLPVILEIERLD
ncbi:MAG: peptidylprolyl isomerase [Verrucomicrobiota bacterium]